MPRPGAADAGCDRRALAASWTIRASSGCSRNERQAITFVEHLDVGEPPRVESSMPSVSATSRLLERLPHPDVASGARRWPRVPSESRRDLARPRGNALCRRTRGICARCAEQPQAHTGVTLIPRAAATAVTLAARVAAVRRRLQCRPVLRARQARPNGRLLRHRPLVVVQTAGRRTPSLG